MLYRGSCARAIASRTLHTRFNACTWVNARGISRRRPAPPAVFDKFKSFLAGPGSDGSDARERLPDQQGVEEDGAEMAPIDVESTGGLGGTSDEVFGPFAVLLVGFMAAEVEAFRSMMLNMEADMVKIIPCTGGMLGAALKDALESEYPQYEQPPLGQRRAIILSGMYGSEVVEVLSAYWDQGLPPAAFAAAVPNNWGRNLGELLESVWRDQAAMVARRGQLLAQPGDGDSA